MEGEEACDAGFDGNKDHLACTSTCQNARCGDGFVQAVLGEACDDGAANVDIPGYDQCSTQCALGAHCGDGVIQAEAGEQCEPSMNPGEMSNCPAMCQHAPRLVFLTSETFTGNLGGLAGADQRCNELAAASLLEGSFRAWLLVDGQTLESVAASGARPTPAQYEEAHRHFERSDEHRTLACVMGALGGVALLTGLGLHIVGGKRARSRLEPALGARFAGLTWRLQF